MGCMAFIESTMIQPCGKPSFNNFKLTTRYNSFMCACIKNLFFTYSAYQYYFPPFGPGKVLAICDGGKRLREYWPRNCNWKSVTTFRGIITSMHYTYENKKIWVYIDTFSSPPEVRRTNVIQLQQHPI